MGRRSGWKYCLEEFCCIVKLSKVLNQGEIYRGVDYIRYMNWNNSRAVGLVQEHYLPNKTLSYEVHNGTYQFDFTGEVISSQELTGKQLGSNHAAKVFEVQLI